MSHIEDHKVVLYCTPSLQHYVSAHIALFLRLKTWLRANTGANHWNDVMFANIQKSNIDKVDMKAFACRFA